MFCNKSCKACFIRYFSLHRIEINFEQMAMLWTSYEHIWKIVSPLNLLWSALSSLFPRDLIIFCCVKPIQINETKKQTGRYLIYYDDNWAKYLQIFMKQCEKPAEIGHALKRGPCWEGRTRLIPSVFYMVAFDAFLKQKPQRVHCFRRTIFFSSQIKKTPVLLGHK